MADSKTENDDIYPSSGSNSVCCDESLESLGLFNRLLLSLNSWLVRIPSDNSCSLDDIEN